MGGHPFVGSNPSLVSCRHRRPILLTYSYSGCDVSRLRDFIADYHSQAHSPQNVDDAYCAFVWSVVAQQPEIQVGTAPEGDPEKYMVAQSDKRDKSKSKHKEEPPVLSPLTLIPDASLKSLDELKAEYGDALRIAVVPERSFIALTGSHIRVYAPFFLSFRIGN